MKSEDEFIEILSRYQGILHKVSLIYFRNEADRQDNFQEIIYHLWKSFPSLEKKQSIGSWIYAVSINTSINRIRKKSRIEYREDLPEIKDLEDYAARLERNESLGLLIAAIRDLGEIDKSVILLYLDDKSYDEISEILGISVTNVGTKISRIKNALKKKLNPEMYGNR